MARTRTVTLPDCHAPEQRFSLSARQRRAIVEALARGGKAGLDAWVATEEKKDPYIRQRIHEAHDRLQREAREERARIQQRYAKERGVRETAWERHVREARERESGLRERIGTLRSGPGLDLNELARQDALYAAATGRDTPGTKRNPLRWLMDALRVIGWTIVLVYTRIVRAIKRLLGISTPPPSTVVTLPDGMRLSLGGLASLRPGLRAQIRYRVHEDKGFRARMRRLVDRLLAREDYAETAAKIMQKDLDERLKADRARRQRQADELEHGLRELEREERDGRRRRQKELERLQEQESRELELLTRQIEQGPYEAMRDELLGMMRDSGLVDARGNPTSALMERFSGILLDEAMKLVPGGGESEPGHYVEGAGDYEKGPLRSLNERGAMELVDSVVNARLRHPHVRHLFDDDLLVHREVRTNQTHVVIILDRSGSMEEAGRMEAAKTVALVLYRAVKEENPDHRVDLVTMSTGIEHVTLADCWNTQPGGFTNHGRALREARLLLEETEADRRLVYLITDGLPEAMTDRNGHDFADRPDLCMPYALEHARRLGEVPGVRLMVIQLEQDDARFIEAAEKIAAAAHGHMERVRPEGLTKRLLGDFQMRRSADA